MRMAWPVSFITLRAPLLLTLLVAATVPAAAQQPSQAQATAIRQNCRADYQARCAGVPTGGQASLACLRQNLSSVSPACRQAVAATGSAASAPAAAAGRGPATAPMSRQQEAAMLRGSCERDYRMFCRGVSPGGGRVPACLEMHRSSLSGGCRGALAAARAPR